MTKIIKEYYESQIDMRGPGALNAKPVTTNTTCILRFKSDSALKAPGLARLFNEAANDFGDLPAASIHIGTDRLEIKSQPPSNAYEALPPRTIGARG